MLRWTADERLAELIRRYYAGEAGLWQAILDRVDEDLRSRGIARGAYHLRLRAHAGGYDVLIEEASAYAQEP